VFFSTEALGNGDDLRFFLRPRTLLAPVSPHPAQQTPRSRTKARVPSRDLTSSSAALEGRKRRQSTRPRSRCARLEKSLQPRPGRTESAANASNGKESIRRSRNVPDGSSLERKRRRTARQAQVLGHPLRVFRQCATGMAPQSRSSTSARHAGFALPNSAAGRLQTT